MNNSRAHSKLVDDVLFAIGSHPRIRAWKRPVGFDSETKTSYGIPGEPDIEFIIAPSGRMGGMEIKTGTGKKSKKQEIRHEMLTKFGAAIFTIRSTSEALTAIESVL